MVPRTVADVLAELDAVIRWSIDERRRLGYFAALYRNVTVEVSEAITGGRFEDGPRMERLVVTFADRYLDAVRQFRSGAGPSRCWAIAFETAERWRPLVLQHLILGINAHINLDLGIAAATTAQGSNLPGLRADFEEINRILAAHVQSVVARIGRVSPWIRLLARVDPKADRAVVNFSIERARDQAWTLADLLACVPAEGWPDRIAVLDRNTESLGRLVRDPPGWLLKAGLRLIKLREWNNVRRVIEVLAGLSGPEAGSMEG